MTKMATIWSYLLTFFVICGVILVGAGANEEDDLREFKKFKGEVFGQDIDRIYRYTTIQKIQKMIKILEAGNIPVEAQGETTKDYLNGLINDCESQKTCNLADVLAKVDRMKKINTNSEYLKSYLVDCTQRVLRSCAEEVYERAKKKLSPLDEEGWAAIRAFAVEVDDEMSPEYFYGHITRHRRTESELSYHKIVLKALKTLYPEAANKVAKRWTKKEKSLRKFMDRIRAPCATFLDNLDPVLDNYPTQSDACASKEPMWKIMLWNFYRKHCRRILNQWEEIFNKSYKVYIKYLAEPKSESTSCFGGYGSSGGGGGYTTGDLIWMSGRR